MIFDLYQFDVKKVLGLFCSQISVLAFLDIYKYKYRFLQVLKDFKKSL